MVDSSRAIVRISTPARWVRHFVYLLWVLILVVGGTSVGTLWLQAKEVNRLTSAIAPAVDANGQVLQAMIDAEHGLSGYQVSADLERLTLYRDARERTMAALATLQDVLAPLRPHAGLDIRLAGRQRLAVEQWWSYAMSTERAVTRGDRVDVLHGDALFDSFRRANTALSEHLGTERDLAQSAARKALEIGMAVVIAATLMALLVTFLLGWRTARSISQPITELRDTMTRQREGDMGVRAREDRGSEEIRSLAADFNTLTEKNLVAQRRVEDVNARLASLVELGLVLGQELSLDALLDRIVESAREVLGARYAAFGVLDATGTGLAEFVTAGLSPEEKVAIGEWPQGLGLLGGGGDNP